MTILIYDKEGTVVGSMNQLDGGWYAITFCDIYMGVFISFDGWNSEHGGAYTLTKNEDNIYHMWDSWDG